MIRNTLLILFLLWGVATIACGYWQQDYYEKKLVCAANSERIVYTPVKVIHTPFPESQSYGDRESWVLLSVEEVIRSSKNAGSSHEYLRVRGKNPEHNAYWRDVHYSAASLLANIYLEVK